MHLIAPSILSADFSQLSVDVTMINTSVADWFHVDVMDGVFVPNISLGFPVIKAIKKHAKKPLDVHLMIVKPERYVEQFREAGADVLTVHLEASTHLHRTLQQIKKEGMKAGVAINPHTPVLVILGYDYLAAGFAHRYFTLDERLLTESRILWDYVGQLYVPDVLRLGLYHDDVVVSTAFTRPPATRYAVLAWLAVLSCLCALMFWRRGRYAALGIAWFLVGHSIESTVFPLELYFEHRNYFPGIGLFLLVGVVFSRLVTVWPEVKSPLLVYLACYVLWLASLTGSQVQIWSSHPLLILNHLNAHPDSFRANADMAVQLANLGQLDAARDYSARAFAVNTAGERSGDRDIRDLALACVAGQPVAPDQIRRLGTLNRGRPFSSVVTLQTLVHLLQDNACPGFDRVGFADRMIEIFLAGDPPATASANIYLGLALLENTLQRWQHADAYIDLYLAATGVNAQGLLMKLHFTRALGKVAEAADIVATLQEMQARGQLTVGEQQTLSLYLEQ